jgi:Cu(I)/Ag(I) efflux system membrane fusion protein
MTTQCITTEPSYGSGLFGTKRAVRAIVVAAVLMARGAHAAEAPVPSAMDMSPGSEQWQACLPERALYFRDPSGAPNYSTQPTKDAVGHDFLPVCDDKEISFDPPKKQPASGSRKILYYRNPMGLADRSTVPKKDSMGMDYIPVYDERADDDKTFKLNLDKIQRSGVRTELVEMRNVVDQVHAYGTVKYDERRITIVTATAEGFADEVLVNTVGQSVRAGEPLFRIYSNSIQNIQMLQLEIARRQHPGATQDPAIQQLLTNAPRPSVLDWPSPVAGTVIDKRILTGQRVMMGEELYRIADLSRMWVIAEISEADIGSVAQGTRAEVIVRSFQQRPIQGAVLFIYPDLRPETRTARVCIEVPNPDGMLKAEMYADVLLQPNVPSAPVTAVPESSVIDSGTRQVVLVAKGDGRFEPRMVKLGVHGQGYVEIREGVREGESVVTAATFLIDSESSLNASLNAFRSQETSP